MFCSILVNWTLRWVVFFLVLSNDVYDKHMTDKPQRLWSHIFKTELFIFNYYSGIGWIVIKLKFLQVLAWTSIAVFFLVPPSTLGMWWFWLYWILSYDGKTYPLWGLMMNINFILTYILWDLFLFCINLFHVLFFKLFYLFYRIVWCWHSMCICFPCQVCKIWIFWIS
jgi:hypothetical protein